jgi:peptide/nickel transport system substrate-binding protein
VKVGAMVGALGFAFAGFALSSCGGGGTSATEGGSLSILTPSFTDYEDPQLGYEATGWEARYNVYIPMLTYAHAEGVAGTKVIPGLAKDLPTVTNGGKTYTMFMQPGLKYSDGTDVKACDFKFAVQRMFDVDSGGAGFYTDIVGATDYQSGKSKDISGITCDDKTGKITIDLTEPRGTFNNELALQFVAPVPPDTPPKDQTANPPPATGPYYFTHVTPGQSWTEERNPEWAKNNAKILSPDLPSGNLDKITSTVVKNYSSATTEIEQNKADDLTDPPPTDRLQEVQSRYPDQYKTQPTVSTYYFWMNTQQPPFDDVKVRQAVNYAVDPAALQRIYGGLMTPTQEILPPNMPGYKKYGPLYPHDMAKAKQLFQQANPSDTDITVWTDTDTPNDKAGEYYQSVLKELGFDAHLKIINGSVYFDVIGSNKTANLDTGWSDWFEDYPHPGDFFDILLNGDNIAPVHNNNYALFDDKALNDEMTKLGHENFTSSVQTQYGDLDQKIMEQAPWVPYGNRELSTFVSDRVDLSSVIWHPVFQEDYANISLTG